MISIDHTFSEEQRPTIRVALVDDQQLVRAGFRMVIDSQPDLTVVLEAGDGAEALRRLALVEVDVVLMDVRMPNLDGDPHGARRRCRDRTVEHTQAARAPGHRPARHGPEPPAPRSRRADGP